MVSPFTQKLYENRIVPVIPFNQKYVVATCTQFSNQKVRREFLTKVGSKSGIYLIEYKRDIKIYYIGQASNFQNRFVSHSQTKTKSKFHKLLRLVGWEQFNVSIIELCPREKLGERENYYLYLYKPILNTIYSTSTVPYKAKVKVQRTLSSELIGLKKNLDSSGYDRAMVPVYVLDLNVNRKFKVKSPSFFYFYLKKGKKREALEVFEWLVNILVALL